MLDIVLVEPEIPHNTGAIARTCACTGARLHLIKPLGFEITDRHLKRAGLDYWYLLDVRIYENLEDFFSQNEVHQMRLFTTKAPRTYTELDYQDECFLFFGKETRGLPEDFLYAHPEDCVKLPMIEEARSLNLSNAVAVGVFEALRQLEFPHLKKWGKMKE